MIARRETWPLVALGDVTSEQCIRSGEEQCSEPVLGVTNKAGLVPMKERLRGNDLSRYKRLKPGWFVYNPMRLDVGSIAKSSLQDDALVSPDYVVFSCEGTRLRPDYLDFIRQSYAWERFVDDAGKGSVRVRIYYHNLGEFRFRLPSLPEQERILTVLNGVDGTIQATEAVIEQTARVKTGLLRQLLTRGLGHTRFKKTELGELPASWRITTLGEAGEWFSGGTPARSTHKYWTGDIPWASPKDMKRAYLSDTIEHVSQAGADKGSRLVPPGTVFVVVRGMILAHSCPVAIARREMAFNQDMKALIAREEFQPEFVLLWLCLQEPVLLARVSQATHGTLRLPTPSLFSMALPAPPLEEQVKIVQHVQTLEEVIDRDKGYLHALRRLKRGLMQDLLTGKVRVPEAA